MKATGIVRRIDDLGRIVIPKEIRKTMHIREGAQLEIFTESDGAVIFRKYSPVGELSDHVDNYAETLAKITGNAVVIADRDAIVATGGIKKDLLHRKIAPETEKLIEGRKTYIYHIGEQRKKLCADEDKVYVGIVDPILQDGDTVGAIIMLIPELGNAPTEAEVKVLSTATLLLRRQMEA